MRIMVTGSSGFIGTELVKSLTDKGYVVLEVDTKTGTNVTEMLDSMHLMDAVIHLAAQTSVRESINDPDLYYKNNVEVTKSLFKAANGLPIVWASSSTVHNWYLNPYATTKKMCELIAPTGSIGLRFTTVYGKTSREGMLVERLLNKSLEFATDHTRDFLHVDDAVSAIEIALGYAVPFNKAQFWDVGTGIGVKVDELADRYCPAHTKINAPANEQDSNVTDARIIRTKGWVPKEPDIYYWLDKNL